MDASDELIYFCDRLLTDADVKDADPTFDDEDDTLPNGGIMFSFDTEDAFGEDYEEED